MLTRILFFAFYLLTASKMQAQSQPQKAIADKIAAVVGDQIILSSDIQNAIEDMKRQDIAVPPNATCMLTEQFIVGKLLMLQAIKDSLPVTEEDVEGELEKRIKAYSQYMTDYLPPSIEKLKNEFRPQLREMMLSQAMQQKIIAGVKITPSEVKAYFDRIPLANLAMIESEMEVGQIILYPSASKDLEQYVINELNNYKKQLESKTISICQLQKIGGKANECKDYEISRNSTYWEPVFIAAAFRLKNGEISGPVKCKFGFYLIQMIERTGDNAVIRYLFRPHPLTDVEITQAKSELNKLRIDITDRRISFNEAALKFSDDNSVKLYGAFLLNQEGSSHVTINEIDKELAGIVEKLNVGDISHPMMFVNNLDIKGVRIVFLKSRTQPHIENLKDDYDRIAQRALEEKRQQVLAKWVAEKTRSYYIMLDPMMSADCPQMKRFASADR